MQAHERAAEPFGPGDHSALAQEFVEMLAIAHADEAILDRNIHMARGGRDHARRADLGNDLRLGNIEIGDQAWRDGSAAGLDAPVSIQHRN